MLGRSKLSVNGRHGASNSGLTFQALSGDSGVTNLPTSLTINGTTVDASFVYRGQDARENLMVYSQDFGSGFWAKTDATIVANAAAAPDGTITADAFISGTNPTSGHNVRQSVTTLNGYQYTYSVYLKDNGRGWVRLLAAGNTSYYAYINIATGEKGTITGATNVRVENAGDGWYRVSLTFVADDTSYLFYIGSAEANNDVAFVGDGSVDFYLWGAQVNTGSKATAYLGTTDSTAIDWPAYVGDEALAEYGAGNAPRVSQYAPFTDGTRAVSFNQGKYYEHATTGDIGTEDFVYELVVSNKSNLWVGKKNNDATSVPGIYFKSEPSTLQFKAIMSDGVSQTYLYPAVPADTWIHVLFVADRSGSFAMYVNGVNVGSKDISSFGSLATSEAFRIGRPTTGEGEVAWVAMWKQSDWLDTHNQDEFARERFAKLAGVYPQVAKGAAVPAEMTRSSIGYLDIDHDEDGIRRLFKVGSNWPRIVKRKDGKSEYFTGLLVEQQQTNLLVNSEDLTNATDWGYTNVTVSSATGGPLGTCYSVASSTTSSVGHALNELTSNFTSETIMCVWAKAGANDWIAIRGNGGGTSTQWFDVANGVVGSNSGADVLDAWIEDWGNGWYRCIAKFQNSATIYLYTTNADATYQYAEATTDPLSYFAGPMVVQGAKYATSYMPTTTSTATRSGDVLRFTSVGNVRDGQVYFEVTSYKEAYTVGEVNHILTWSLSSDPTGERTLLRTHTIGNQYWWVNVTGNGADDFTYNGAGVDLADGSLLRWKGQFSSVGTKLSANDTALVDDSTISVADYDQFYLGGSETGVAQWNGVITNLKMYKRLKL